LGELRCERENNVANVSRQSAQMEKANATKGGDWGAPL